MKTKEEIYQQLLVKLPIERKNGQSLINCIDEFLQDYKNLTSSLYTDNEDYAKVISFCDDVHEIFELYWQGFTHKAYLLFEKHINNLLSVDESRYTGILPIYNRNYDAIYLTDTDDFRYFYRISDRDNSFPHIPFEFREFAGSQRFTVPGLPCFYGGNTIETCLKEIGATAEFDNYFVSCFDFSYTQESLLDLTLPKITVDEKEGVYFDKAIFSWPLVAICMIRRSGNSANEKAKFIPEYIFPQFILEHLSKKNKTQIKAVRYFSTKFDDVTGHINIAIPAREFKDKGHCEYLLSLFNEGQRLSTKAISGYSKPVKLSSICTFDDEVLKKNIEYYY